MIERWEALGNLEFLYILPQYICVGIIVFALLTVIASSIIHKIDSTKS
jgi:hypothetical protein